MRPRQMYWLYVTVIRPMITYGSVAWWSKGLQKQAQAKLSSLQRQACLLITGAFRTTPTAAMEVLLELPPLHILLEREAGWTTYRFRQAALNEPSTGHLEDDGIPRDIMSRDLLNMPSDMVHKHRCCHRPYKVVIPDRREWTDRQEELLKADICWFTDGSKMDQGVGAGVFGGPEKELSFSLGKHATIFQAEVFAIEKCAQALLERQYSRKAIKIFSDSQAALKALESDYYYSKVVRECRDSLGRLCERGNRVTLLWIPSHSGLEGNETADSLARRGAEAVFTGPEPALGIAGNMARQDIHAWAQERVRQHWLGLPGLRHAKEFMACPQGENRLQKMLGLDRVHLRALVGLYTGHCALRHHMHRLGLADESECRLCMEDDETAKHILCECPAAAGTRLSVFGTPYLRPQDLRWVQPRKVLSLVERLGLLGKI